MHAKKAAKLSAGRKVRRLKGHNIFETWVTFALKNITDGGSACEDRRVPYKVRAHKIEEYIKNMVRSHINMFPVVLYRYVKKNSTRMYFEEGLNILKLYRFNKVYVNSNYININLATARQYR